MLKFNLSSLSFVSPNIIFKNNVTGIRIVISEISENKHDQKYFSYKTKLRNHILLSPGHLTRSRIKHFFKVTAFCGNLLPDVLVLACGCRSRSCGMKFRQMSVIVSFVIISLLTPCVLAREVRFRSESAFPRVVVQVFLLCKNFCTSYLFVGAVMKLHSRSGKGTKGGF